jgi:hypothetical protein
MFIFSTMTASAHLALGCNEAPDFITLDLLACQAAHFAVHDLLATFANADAKPHDGITVNA